MGVASGGKLTGPLPEGDPAPILGGVALVTPPPPAIRLGSFLTLVLLAESMGSGLAGSPESGTPLVDVVEGARCFSNELNQFLCLFVNSLMFGLTEPKEVLRRSEAASLSLLFSITFLW